MDQHCYMIEGYRANEWCTLTKKQLDAMNHYFYVLTGMRTSRIQNETQDNDTETQQSTMIRDVIEDEKNFETQFKEGKFTYAIYQEHGIDGKSSDPRYFIENVDTKVKREVFLVNLLLPQHTSISKSAKTR